MNFNSLNSFSYIILIYFFILIFSLCIFIPTFSNHGYVVPSNITSYGSSFEVSNGKFVWPTPGYTTITSNFGYRTAPTSGASSYHSGIDIGAPTGSNIVSIFSGTVSFIGFSGAGGYTVTVKNDDFSVSYCHVSPNFLVCVGQSVYKGNIIAKVGPKNIYGVPNNPYRDSNGNPTNGATTRTSSSSYIKKRRQSRQSSKLFLKYITYLLRLHGYNVNNFLRILLHGNHIRLPNLIQLSYYTLGILLHL